MAPPASLDEAISNLRSNSTIANAFRAWLLHCESTLPPAQLRSAKNFARAFQIYFDKSRSHPGACEDWPLSASFFYNQVEDFADCFQLEANPITERLSPVSKTTKVAANYRSLTIFLGKQRILGESDVTQSLRACAFFEDDLKRCRRANWLLTQYHLYFHPKIGGHIRPTNLVGQEAEGLFEVATIKDNFILADKRNEDPETGDPIRSPDDPIKILLPRLATTFLKVGDDIHACVRKAADGDYWVITFFYSVEPGSDKFEDSKPQFTEDGLGSTETSDVEALARRIDNLQLDIPIRTEMKLIDEDEGYKHRKESRWNSSPPSDGFPEEIYTEQWFSSREIDIASDEEVGAIWDIGSDEDDPDSDSSGINEI